MKVLWKVGMKRKVDPGDAYEVIERIRSECDGFASPGAIVDASRPARAMLHDLFEWDDEKAADGYRRDQARAIVQALVVEEVEGGELKPAFYSVSYRREDKPEHGYSTSEIVVNEPELKDAALRDGVKMLRGWIDRFGHLTDLSGVLRAVRKVENQLSD